MNTRKQSAFSLIELMCVMGIIGIMAALLLGPAFKALDRAKRLDWEIKAPAMFERVLEQLQAWENSGKTHPKLSIARLEQNGILDEPSLRFLRLRKVHYFPFASSDPDETVILVVEFGKGSWVLHKKDLTPPPTP